MILYDKTVSGGGGDVRRISVELRVRLCSRMTVYDPAKCIASY
jgi:hypothetical protein